MHLKLSYLSESFYSDRYIYFFFGCGRWFIGLSIKRYVCGQRGEGASDGKIY